MAAGEGFLAMIAAAHGAMADNAPVVATALPQSAAPASAAGHSRVLVVDDNEVNRDVLARRLVGEVHAVEAAHNGVKALAMLENQPFDMVLLDIMMPEMNGYETLARIRADVRPAPRRRSNAD